MRKQIRGSQGEGLGRGQDTPSLEHSLSQPGLGHLKGVWLSVDNRGDPGAVELFCILTTVGHAGTDPLWCHCTEVNTPPPNQHVNAGEI